jgi:hypothetical protein
LLVVEPIGTEPSLFGNDMPEAEVQAIVRWVEWGNTLVLVGRHPGALHQALRVKLQADQRSEVQYVPREVEVADLGAYTRDIDTVVIEGTDSVEAPGGLPLWSQNGQPGALVIGRGKGRAIVLPDASMLTNRGLDQKNRPSNGDFLYNVFSFHSPDGAIYFDEYHHGFHSGGGFWGYLAFHRLRWILVPLLVTALMAAWAGAVRLGPPVPLVAPRQADAVDYASALARIYQRAGALGLLARGAARDFLARLTRLTAARRGTLPAEFLAIWQKRAPGALGADRLRELLDGLARIRTGTVSERWLLNWTRTADHFLLEQTATPRSARP